MRSSARRVKVLPRGVVSAPFRAAGVRFRSPRSPWLRSKPFVHMHLWLRRRREIPRSHGIVRPRLCVGDTHVLIVRVRPSGRWKSERGCSSEEHLIEACHEKACDNRAQVRMAVGYGMHHTRKVHVAQESQGCHGLERSEKYFARPQTMQKVWHDSAVRILLGSKSVTKY